MPFCALSGGVPLPTLDGAPFFLRDTWQDGNYFGIKRQACMP